jgi:hypothetical protein
VQVLLALLLLLLPIALELALLVWVLPDALSLQLQHQQVHLLQQPELLGHSSAAAVQGSQSQQLLVYLLLLLPLARQTLLLRYKHCASLLLLQE